MKTAAVSELKASLSEYLAMVKAGEEVIVTDRGKPVARIIPLQRDREGIPAHLLDLERAGLARLGSNKLPAGFWRLMRVRDRNGKALRSLLDEREEA
jgi:prevent-host-death family protein